MTKTNEELLKNIREYAKKENLSVETESYTENDPRLIEAALELAGRSKSILSGLYFDFRKAETGAVRKLKNKIIGKIANIVRNTLERPLLTQQKFNEQTFYLLNVLLEEHKKLKEELEKLKQAHEA